MLNPFILAHLMHPKGNFSNHTEPQHFITPKLHSAQSQFQAFEFDGKPHWVSNNLPFSGQPQLNHYLLNFKQNQLKFFQLLQFQQRKIIQNQFAKKFSKAKSGNLEKNEVKLSKFLSVKQEKNLQCEFENESNNTAQSFKHSTAFDQDSDKTNSENEKSANTKKSTECHLKHLEACVNNNLGNFNADDMFPSMFQQTVINNFSPYQGFFLKFLASLLI